MGDISIKGHGCERRGSKDRTGHNKGGRVGLKFGGGRTDLLEELGRVEAEPSNRNRRAEVARVHGELNRGYNKGGRVGRDKGTPKSGEKGFKHKGTVQEIKKKIFGIKGKRYDRSDATTDAHHPAVSKELEKKGLTSKKVEEDIRKEEMKSYRGGGRVGAKKGGDSRWIQKVDASIKRRGTKGKCTPITKPGCTGRAKALAKTFKKMAKKRKAA